MRYLRYALPALLLVAACSDKNKTESAVNGSPSVHTIAEALRIFYEPATIPQFLENSRSEQVSSYDTTWQNDDGFNGKYSFLRRNADSTLVIFDVAGSGVINRIWTPTPNEDTLDFFIDDAAKPAFSIRFIDLFSGAVYPFVAPLCGNQLGGYYCYLPIPFKNHCKIVSRGKYIQFHQIQYRTFPEAEAVKSFSMALSAEDKEGLAKIAALWDKPSPAISDFYGNDYSEHLKSYVLKPGETLPVFETNQGGRILGFEIDPGQAFEGLSRNVDLRITWDDESNPAIFCPLADFFGYAFGKASMQSLLLGQRNNTNYCYFPMPFDSNAKIELVYRASEHEPVQPLSVNVKVWYSGINRNPVTEGKFYTFWNRKLQSEPGKPHTFLDVTGKGHYVGTILLSQGLKAGMTYFFEGDDSTAIDNEFRMHGTGSEDYFNGGWYAMLDRWDGKMSLPLHGALDYSLPFCRTGGYRFFLPDKMSFQKQFFHSIEHGPVRNNFPVDYTSLAFYYSDTPAKQVTEPTAHLSRVFLPDTLMIYPQLMDYNIFEDVDIRTTWKYGTGGESYLFTPASDDSWLRISLRDIPDGNYMLLADVMMKPDGCEFSVWQRQRQVSDWISTQQASEKRVSLMVVKDIDIREFKNTVTFRFKTDKQKTGFLFNRIILIRQLKPA